MSQPNDIINEPNYIINEAIAQYKDIIPYNMDYYNINNSNSQFDILPPIFEIEHIRSPEIDELNAIYQGLLVNNTLPDGRLNLEYDTVIHFYNRDTDTYEYRTLDDFIRFMENKYGESLKLQSIDLDDWYYDYNKWIDFANATIL